MFEFGKRRMFILVSKTILVLGLFSLVLLNVNTQNPNGSVISDKSSGNFDIHFEKRPLFGVKTEAIDIEAEIQKLNKEKVPADDPRLVHLIRNKFIIPPSELSYNLVNAKTLDTSKGQATYVDSKLKFKEGGFFVESGAHDGEYLSNTLYLERQRHWTGLLIEPLPKSFQILRNKHRKAYSLNACLSLHQYPSKENMSEIPVDGSIMDGRKLEPNIIALKLLVFSAFLYIPFCLH